MCFFFLTLRYCEHTQTRWEGHHDLRILLLPRLCRRRTGQIFILTFSKALCTQLHNANSLGRFCFSSISFIMDLKTLSMFINCSSGALSLRLRQLPTVSARCWPSTRRTRNWWRSTRSWPARWETAATEHSHTRSVHAHPPLQHRSSGPNASLLGSKLFHPLTHVSVQADQ